MIGFDPYQWYPPETDEWRGCCYSELRESCTCWEPIWDVPPPVFDASLPTEVRLEMCGGCAYRPGTDAWTCRTASDLPADTAKRFYCHEGARRILGYRHPDGTEIMLPPEEIDHKGDEHDGRPFFRDGTPAPYCAGWAARYPSKVAAAVSPMAQEQYAALIRDMRKVLEERYQSEAT